MEIYNNHSGDERPIGIFDSGVGGLTVVSEVMKNLPNENIIYFGDTARVPYGSKSKENITKFSKQIVNFLLSKNVKSIIIACNTASSNSYDELVMQFDVPIIEVVKPGASLCLSDKKAKNIGVIGTVRTVNSKAYDRELKKINPDVNVYSKACPLFVPLVEEGWTDNEVALLTANNYLAELLDNGIDSLILGCTHYPLLTDCSKKVVGDVSVVNPAEATAKDMKLYLEKNNILNLSGVEPEYKFYVSDNASKFDDICTLVLNKKYEAEIVDIEQY